MLIPNKGIRVLDAHQVRLVLTSQPGLPLLLLLLLLLLWHFGRQRLRRLGQQRLFCKGPSCSRLHTATPWPSLCSGPRPLSCWCRPCCNLLLLLLLLLALLLRLRWRLIKGWGKWL
jgi:hypothetical protein